MAAAADERAERVRAAHQAKLARADQQAALAQQRKVEQSAELKKRSQLVTARNQEIHYKRYNDTDTDKQTSCCTRRALACRPTQSSVISLFLTESVAMTRCLNGHLEHLSCLSPLLCNSI